MRWFTKHLRNVGMASVSMLFLLTCLALIPLSAASAHKGTLEVATPTTVMVQATPTEDATVTTLTKEQLVQQVAGQQHTWDNWLWSNVATILSSFLSMLVVVIGVLFGFWQWRVGRMDTQKKESDDQKAAQDKELEDRKAERERRDEEQQRWLRDQAEKRFQAAVEGLSSEREEAKVGAAILLRTFLHPDYKQSYTQAFDLAVAHLRLPGTSNPSVDPDNPLPLTTLKQALIVVFKEAFPLAREKVLKEQGHQERLQSLDASRVQLDNAYLRKADLKQVWMREASLREVNLIEADLYNAQLRNTDLSGAILAMADLRKADLSITNLSKASLHQADLREANLSGVRNLEDALSLKDTKLRGVKGLTKEQLKACEAKGAIID